MFIIKYSLSKILQVVQDDGAENRIGLGCTTIMIESNESNISSFIGEGVRSGLGEEGYYNHLYGGGR